MATFIIYIHSVTAAIDFIVEVEIRFLLIFHSLLLFLQDKKSTLTRRQLSAVSSSSFLLHCVQYYYLHR